MSSVARLFVQPMDSTQPNPNKTLAGILIVVGLIIIVASLIWGNFALS